MVNHWRFRTMRQVMLSLCVLAAFTGVAQSSAIYRLDAQDKVRLKLYEWRANSNEAYQWEALNGEFTVSTSGELSLPLLGQVPAAGKTTAELATDIASKLQDKIGLSKRPEASVEVVEYRPFFILGAVNKPGEYPYKPNLNVLKAVSTAGGVYRNPQATVGLNRDALAAEGDIKGLIVERDNLLLKRVRLQAELNGDATFEVPGDLAEFVTQPAGAHQLEGQTALLKIHRDGESARVEAASRTKTLITNEITALRSKSQSLLRQLEIAKKELSSVSSLVAKGLAVTSRELALDQNAAQFESGGLDVSLAILRAQQELERIDRDLVEAQNKYRNDLFAEMQTVRERLSTIDEKIQTSNAVLHSIEAEAEANGMAASSDPEISALVTRQVDGINKTLVVAATDDILPGDIVQVVSKIPSRRTTARPATAKQEPLKVGSDARRTE